jgi:predicted Zn-dependent protease
MEHWSDRLWSRSNANITSYKNKTDQSGFPTAEHYYSCVIDEQYNWQQMSKIVKMEINHGIEVSGPLLALE